jgi:DUF4097 and DUF4098 domain-containing protein YvlB
MAATVTGCYVDTGALQHQTSSYSVTGRIGALVVNDHLGSVHVTGGATGAVSVTEHISYRHAAPATTHQVAAGTLTLDDHCPANETCGVTYDIRVPASTSVQVNDAAGVLQLNLLTGPVTAHTNAGDIEVSRLSGPIELTDHAGSIRGDVSSTRAILRSSVGSVVVRFTTVPFSVTATTGVGAVTLTVPGGVAYAVDAHTSVGSTHIGVAVLATSPHVIAASTRTGSVTIQAGA